MANTYTQMYVHVVFAVQGRQSIIPAQKKEELFKYITGIVKNRGQKLIEINGMPDHLHVFMGIKPTIALSDLIRDVKAGSSGFINEKGWIRGRFSWQEGFGAFTHSHAEIERVVHYIERQEEHHRTATFHEEYVQMLKEFAVEYNSEYLFKRIDEDADHEVAPDGA